MADSGTEAARIVVRTLLMVGPYLLAYWAFCRLILFLVNRFGLKNKLSSLTFEGVTSFTYETDKFQSSVASFSLFRRGPQLFRLHASGVAVIVPIRRRSDSPVDASQGISGELSSNYSPTIGLHRDLNVNQISPVEINNLLDPNLAAATAASASESDKKTRNPLVEKLKSLGLAKWLVALLELAVQQIDIDDVSLTLIPEEFPDIVVDVRIDHLKVAPGKDGLGVLVQGCDASVLRSPDPEAVREAVQLRRASSDAAISVVTRQSSILRSVRCLAEVSLDAGFVRLDTWHPGADFDEFVHSVRVGLQRPEVTVTENLVARALETKLDRMRRAEMPRTMSGVWNKPPAHQEEGQGEEKKEEEEAMGEGTSPRRRLSYIEKALDYASGVKSEMRLPSSSASESENIEKEDFEEDMKEHRAKTMHSLSTLIPFKVDLSIEDVRLRFWQQLDVELSFKLRSFHFSLRKWPDLLGQNLFETLKANLGITDVAFFSRKWNVFQLRRLSFLGQLAGKKDFDNCHTRIGPFSGVFSLGELHFWTTHFSNRFGAIVAQMSEVSKMRKKTAQNLKVSVPLKSKKSKMNKMMQLQRQSVDQTSFKMGGPESANSNENAERGDNKSAKAFDAVKAFWNKHIYNANSNGNRENLNNNARNYNKNRSSKKKGKQDPEPPKDSNNPTQKFRVSNNSDDAAKEVLNLTKTSMDATHHLIETSRSYTDLIRTTRHAKTTKNFHKSVPSSTKTTMRDQNATNLQQDIRLSSLPSKDFEEFSNLSKSVNQSTKIVFQRNMDGNINARDFYQPVDKNFDINTVPLANPEQPVDETANINSFVDESKSFYAQADSLDNSDQGESTSRDVKYHVNFDSTAKSKGRVMFADETSEPSEPLHVQHPSESEFAHPVPQTAQSKSEQLPTQQKAQLQELDEFYASIDLNNRRKRREEGSRLRILPAPPQASTITINVIEEKEEEEEEGFRSESGSESEPSATLGSESIPIEKVLTMQYLVSAVLKSLFSTAWRLSFEEFHVILLAPNHETVSVGVDRMTLSKTFTNFKHATADSKITYFLQTNKDMTLTFEIVCIWSNFGHAQTWERGRIDYASDVIGLPSLRLSARVVEQRVETTIEMPRLQLGWSSRVTALVDQIVRGIGEAKEQLKTLSPAARRVQQESRLIQQMLLFGTQAMRTERSELARTFLYNAFRLTATLEGIDLHFSSSRNVGLRLRIDSAVVTIATLKNVGVVICGVKLAKMMPDDLQSVFDEQMSYEINNLAFFQIDEIIEVRADDFPSQKVIQISASTYVGIHWSFWLFMTIYTFMEDIHVLKELVATTLLPPKPPSRFKEERTLVADGQYHGSRTLPTIKAKISTLKVSGALLTHFVVAIRGEDVFVGGQLPFVDIKIGYAYGIIEGRELIEVDNFNFAFKEMDKFIAGQRKVFPDIILETNKCLVMLVDHVGATIPYDVDIWSIKEGILLTRNFLRTVRRVPRFNYYISPSSIMPDIRLKVARVTIVMEADPFEAAVLRNIELMKDERNETIKRNKICSEMVKATHKKQGIYEWRNSDQDKAHIDEVYARLREMNANIYVSRVNRLRSVDEFKMQLKLYAQGVDVCIMGDISLAGTAGMDAIRRMDHACPYPEKMDLKLMRGCYVVFTLDNAQVQPCNHPKPLIEVSDFALYTPSVVFSKWPEPQQIRQTSVVVGEPFDDVVCLRNMTPSKFCSDINIKVAKVVFRVGNSFASVISVFLHLMSNISLKIPQDGIPLPGWDKVRAMLLGPVTIHLDHVTIELLASLNPFEFMEKLEIVLSSHVEGGQRWAAPVILQIKDSSFSKDYIFQGDVRVFLRSAHKFDNTCILRIPRLRLFARVAWYCGVDLKGNPMDHYTMGATAVGKAPPGVDLETYDAFANFRGRRLSLTVNVETLVPKDLQKLKEEANRPSFDMDMDPLFDAPSCFLCANMIPYLKKVILALTRKALPVRRGSIFGTEKKQKKTIRDLGMGAIQKLINVSARMFRVDASFWDTHNQINGVHMKARSIRGRLLSWQEPAIILKRGKMHHSFGVKKTHLYNRILVQDVIMWAVASAQKPKGTSVVSSRTMIAADSETKRIVMLHRFDVRRVERHPDIQWSDLMEVDDIEEIREEVEAIDDEITPGIQISVAESKFQWDLTRREILYAIIDSFMTVYKTMRSLSANALAVAFALADEGALELEAPAGAAEEQDLWEYLAALLDEEGDWVPPEGEDNYQHLTLTGFNLATKLKDLVASNWGLEMKNAQVLIKGKFTKGYTIICAPHVVVVSSIHYPIFEFDDLRSKHSMTAHCKGIQSYVTVLGDKESQLGDEDVVWVPEEHITQDFDHKIIQTKDGRIRLMRMFCPCNLHFYQVKFFSINDLTEATSLGSTENVQEAMQHFLENPADMGISISEGTPDLTISIFFRHIFVRSSGYGLKIFVDVLENVLLDVPASIKAARAQEHDMKIKFHLHSENNIVHAIHYQQAALRKKLAELYELHQKLYFYKIEMKAFMEREMLTKEGEEEIEKFEKEIHMLGKRIAAKVDVLDAMVRCYREMVLVHHRLARASRKMEKGQENMDIIQRFEMAMKDMKVYFHSNDGEQEIAKVKAQRFFLHQDRNADNSGRIEVTVGPVSLDNPKPGACFKKVFQPDPDAVTSIGTFFRMIFKTLAPVNGIKTFQQIEFVLNPCELNIQMSFVKSLIAIFSLKKGKKNDRKDKKGEEESSSSLTESDKFESGTMGAVEEHYKLMGERANAVVSIISLKVNQVDLRLSFKVEHNSERLHTFPIDVKDWHFRLPAYEKNQILCTPSELMKDFKKFAIVKILKQIPLHLVKIKPESKPIEEMDDDEKIVLLFGNDALENLDRPRPIL